MRKYGRCKRAKKLQEKKIKLNKDVLSKYKENSKNPLEVTKVI